MIEADTTLPDVARSLEASLDEALEQGQVQMQWGVKIPLRDGVHLSANMYLPRTRPGPTPAILSLTPYIAQGSHDTGLYFAAQGYVFLAVDVRGRGNSEGDFHPFLQEAKDGFDVVEWIAQQRFCNGKVAMYGGSYCGYDQWVTAKEFPPHLTTIVPVAAAYLAVDVWMRNNVSYPYLMQWLTLVSGRTLQDKIFWGNEQYWATRFRLWFESGKPFRQLDTMLGNSSAIFQEWLDHPRVDDYWDKYNPAAEEYARIDFPVLSITGMYDSDQPGALAHHREHLRNAPPTVGAKHYLIIGPWHHAGTRTPQKEFGGVHFGDASLLDLRDLHRQWYDWTLRRGPKPKFLQKRVAYYVAGTEKWRYADALEEVTASIRPLYLHSNGKASHVFSSGDLRDEICDGPADTYVYDPRDTSCAEIEAASTDALCLRPTFPTEDLTDQRLMYAMEGKCLFYHSAPFHEDVEISGFFSLAAWISIDQLDTDFCVSIYAIAPEGSSILLTTDIMRARYRESLRRERLVNTIEPLRYDFERFTFVSRWLAKGSRLRLVIGPLNSIHFQKNYNSGGVVADESADDARTVTVKLFHDATHPSALYIPFGQPDSTHAPPSAME